MPFQVGHDQSGFKRAVSVTMGRGRSTRGRGGRSRGSRSSRGRGASVRGRGSYTNTNAPFDMEPEAGGECGDVPPNSSGQRVGGSRSVGARGERSVSARGGRGGTSVEPVAFRVGAHHGDNDVIAGRCVRRTPPRPDGMSNEVRSTLRDQEVRWNDDVERARRGAHDLRAANNIQTFRARDAARETGIIDDHENSVNVICAICQLVLEDPVQLKCEHACCKDCMSTVVRNQAKKKMSCPLCKTPFQYRDLPQGMRAFQTIIHSLRAWCPNAMDRSERAEAGAVWVETHSLDVEASEAPSGNGGAAVVKFGAVSKTKSALKKVKMSSSPARGGPKSERTSADDADDAESADEKVRTATHWFSLMCLRCNCVNWCSGLGVYLRECVCRLVAVMRMSSGCS